MLFFVRVPFLIRKVNVQSYRKSAVYACVSFFHPHADRLTWPLAPLAEMWSDSLFKRGDALSPLNKDAILASHLVPLNRIAGKFASGVFDKQSTDLRSVLGPRSLASAIEISKGNPMAVLRLPLRLSN